MGLLHVERARRGTAYISCCMTFALSFVLCKLIAVPRGIFPILRSSVATTKSEQLLCAYAAAYVSRREGAARVPGMLARAHEPAFLQLVHDEGMAPVVLSVYNRNPDSCPGLPVTTRAALREQKESQHMECLRFTGTLVEVVRALEAEGIATIPFKGPTFAHAYYGDIGRRSFGDLDLLVPREQLRRAKRVLIERGFCPQLDLSPEEEQAYIDQRLAYAFLHAEEGTPVELHWSVLPLHNGSTLPSELLWQRHRWAAFQGERVRSLDPALYAVYLCAHAAKHRWAKLKWLVDIALLIQSLSPAERQDVAELARALGFARIVGTGVRLLRDVMGVSPAHPLQDLERDPRARELATEVQQRWLFDKLGEGPFGPTTHFHLRERERLRDRIPFALHSLRLLVQPSEKDQAFIELPERLKFLYPLIRPIRVAGERLRKSPSSKNYSERRGDGR